MRTFLRTLSRPHLLEWTLGAFVCLLLPAWSWLDGSGSLAWTMYAHSSSYRLRITAIDRLGKPRSIAPSALAVHSEQDLSTALGGAESFRHARQGRLLRIHLPAIAALACEVSHVASVTLTLEEQLDLEAPLLTTRESRACGSAN